MKKNFLEDIARVCDSVCEKPNAAPTRRRGSGAVRSKRVVDATAEEKEAWLRSPESDEIFDIIAIYPNTDEGRKDAMHDLLWELSDKDAKDVAADFGEHYFGAEMDVDEFESKMLERVVTDEDFLGDFARDFRKWASHIPDRWARLMKGYRMRAEDAYPNNVSDAAGDAAFKVGDKVSITGPEAKRRSAALYGKEGVVKEYVPVNNLIVVDIDGTEQALQPSVCEKIGDAVRGRRPRKIGDFRNRIIERPLLIETLDYPAGLGWINMGENNFVKHGEGAEEYFELKHPEIRGLESLMVKHPTSGSIEKSPTDQRWIATLVSENGIRLSGAKEDSPKAAVASLKDKVEATILAEKNELAEAETRLAGKTTDSRIRYKLGDSTVLSQEQLEANTPAWVADKEKWTEAVARATDGGKKEVDGTLVAAVYKKLGGTIAGKKTDAADDAAELKKQYQEAVAAEKEAREAYDKLNQLSGAELIKEDNVKALNEAYEHYKAAMDKRMEIYNEVINSRDAVSDSANTNFIFPAGSAAVIGKKGHFPLSDVAQARNALAQVAKYDKLPEWYIGNLTLEKFKAKVRRDVKAAFPSIEVTDSKGRVQDSFEEEIGITADMEREDAHDKLREYLDANNHSVEAIEKVARVLLERGEESLKVDRESWKELMAVSTTQNGKPQYSYKQHAWTLIEDPVTDDAGVPAEKVVKRLRDWCDASHAFLSERTDYARGYKAGIAQAKVIANDILTNPNWEVN